MTIDSINTMESMEELRRALANLDLAALNSDIGRANLDTALMNMKDKCDIMYQACADMKTIHDAALELVGKVRSCTTFLVG